MKNVIFNLYHREYLTFYLVAWLLDLLSIWLFKIPLITLLICFTMLIISTANILKRFKK